MKRWDLLISDEYVKTTVECVVTSRKKITNIRAELNDFFLKYRDELLHGNQGNGCSNKKCKVCYPYGHKK